MITLKKYKSINEARGKATPGDYTEDQTKLLNVGKDANKALTKYQYAIDEPTNDDAIWFDNVKKDRQRPKNYNFIASQIKANQPFFILGHPGWGKTSIIKNIAKGMGFNIITVYLDKALPEDLGGIPIPKNIKRKVEKDNKVSEEEVTIVQNAMPIWAAYILDNPDHKFLLFFDEMNQASEDVLKALMPIFLEREVCGVKFNNFWVGGAGNYPEDNTAVNKLPDGLKSRIIGEWNWNEEGMWDNAFDYLRAKFKKEGKLPERLVQDIININICKNPRELESLLNYIKENKDDDGFEMPIDSIIDIISRYSMDPMSAEVEQTAQLIFDYWYSEAFDSDLEDTKDEDVEGLKSDFDTSVVINALELGYVIVNDHNTKKQEQYFIGWDNVADIYELTPEEKEIIKRQMVKLKKKAKYEVAPDD